MIIVMMLIVVVIIVVEMVGILLVTVVGITLIVVVVTVAAQGLAVGGVQRAFPGAPPRHLAHHVRMYAYVYVYIYIYIYVRIHTYVMCKVSGRSAWERPLDSAYREALGCYCYYYYDQCYSYYCH